MYKRDNFRKRVVILTFFQKNFSEFALAIVLFCMKCINEGVAKGRKRRKIEKTIADKAGKAKWKNWKRKAGDPSF